MLGIKLTFTICVSLIFSYSLSLSEESQYESQTNNHSIRVPVVVCHGDINNDDKVDVADLIRGVDIILDLPPKPTEQERTAADVNNDGKSNLRDWLVIIKTILEIGDLHSIGLIPSGQKTFT